MLYKAIDAAGFEMLLGLAAKTGEAIMAIYGQREELAHSIKGDNSPLTTAESALTYSQPFSVRNPQFVAWGGELE